MSDQVRLPGPSTAGRPPVSRMYVDLQHQLRRKLLQSHRKATVTLNTTRRYETRIRVKERVRILKMVLGWVK